VSVLCCRELNDCMVIDGQQKVGDKGLVVIFLRLGGGGGMMNEEAG
jgi:hypothetical protein